MPFSGVSQYNQPEFDLSSLGDWESQLSSEEMKPPPGSEYIANGSPSSGGGKKGGPSNWWALAAAPIIAMLGSKLSGGKISPGDALGNLGQGFASSKLQQLTQRRQREFEEEGHTIELAHKAVQGLGKLSPESMQKYPRLQELSQKYSESLADDGKISAKEASEIIVLHQMAQNDMSKAQQGQDQDEESQITRRKTLEQGQNVEDAQRAGVERQVMRGPWGPLGNEGISQKVDEGFDAQYGTIPVNVNGQSVQMSRKEAVPYVRLEQQKQKADATLKIVQQRLGLARQGLGLASKKFDWAQQNATLNRANMLARSFASDPDFEGASPEEIAEMVIQATQAGLNDPSRMAPPPKSSGVSGGVSSSAPLAKKWNLRP